MTTEQKTNFIEWFRDILLAFENFFHQIQAWFEGTIMQQEWFKNVMSAAAAEEESST